MTISPAQAWARLHRHAREDIVPLPLQELCRDPDRVTSLVTVHNSTVPLNVTTNNSTSNTATHSGTGTAHRTMIVDLSRQRLTDMTMNLLFSLSTSMGLKRFIRQLSWGTNNPDQPIRPSSATDTSAPSNDSNRPMHNDPLLSMPQIYHPPGKPQKINTTLSHDTLESLPPAVALKANAYSTRSAYLVLRVPMGQGYAMCDCNGHNILQDVHSSWDRIEQFSNSIRSGKLKGGASSTTLFRDVVVVGRGVPVAALKFIYTALCCDERASNASRMGVYSPTSHSTSDHETKGGTAGSRLRLGNFTSALQSPPLAVSSSTNKAQQARRIKFLTSIDPVAAAAVVSDCDPASTLIVSVSLTGTEETVIATKILKQWLLQGLLTNKNLSNNTMMDEILAKHMILITGNERIASAIHKPESVYMIPECTRSEPFTTCTAATLLPLAVVFGWSVVREFLAGAHDMDVHFVEKNMRYNLPVLLALTDTWNDCIVQNTPSRVVVPFCHAMEGYPTFVAALESQICSAATTDESTNQSLGIINTSISSMVIDGGGGGSTGLLDRALFQSDIMVNSELTMLMDAQASFNSSRFFGNTNSKDDDIRAAEDALICSFFAHADELALGRKVSYPERFVITTPHSPTSATSMPSDLLNSSWKSGGNRPSILLLCDKLDAFCCGQLIALSEHRATVKCHITGKDPFLAQETGSSIRMERTEDLLGELMQLYNTNSKQEGMGAKSGEDDDDREQPLSLLSTKTLLGHYANIMRGTRK